jgi:hypothetical protein
MSDVLDDDVILIAWAIVETLVFMELCKFKLATEEIPSEENRIYFEQ